MSFLHAVVNSVLMKNRRFYDPKNPKDYVLARENEKKAAMRKIPKGIAVFRETIGGVPCERILREGNPEDQIVLYIHGGGFVTGSSEARRSFTVHIADQIGLNVISLDYRLAPEHPFPAGWEDCFSAYAALIQKYDPKKIVLLGESAGGNLVLSLLLMIRANGLREPAGVFALSPTVQYDRLFQSYTENLPKDAIVTNLSEETIDVCFQTKEDAVVKNPMAAPLYGDYTGCPPVVLFVSDSEVLLDDSLYLFAKLREENVPVRLYVRHGMMHTWLIVPLFAESKKDLALLGRDMRSALQGTLEGREEPIVLNRRKYEGNSAENTVSHQSDRD